MFTTKRSSKVLGTIDTLIGANAIIDGNIEGDGNMRIEGKIRGNVSINGDITIGRTACITGNVIANNIELDGIVEGNIRSNGLLRMSATSKLYGDIEVESFVSDQGAVFEGKCSMLNPAPKPVDDILSTIKDIQPSEKTPSKSHSKDFKKSSLLNQLNDDGKHKK